MLKTLRMVILININWTVHADFHIFFIVNIIVPEIIIISSEHKSL